MKRLAEVYLSMLAFYAIKRLRKGHSARKPYMRIFSSLRKLFVLLLSVIGVFLCYIHVFCWSLFCVYLLHYCEVVLNIVYILALKITNYCIYYEIQDKL